MNNLQLQKTITKEKFAEYSSINFAEKWSILAPKIIKNFEKSKIPEIKSFLNDPKVLPLLQTHPDVIALKIISLSPNLGRTLSIGIGTNRKKITLTKDQISQCFVLHVEVRCTKIFFIEYCHVKKLVFTNEKFN